MRDRLPLFIFAGIFVVGAIIATYMIKNKNNDGKARYLPIKGDKIAKGEDTTFHTVMDFSFTNQLGKTITQKDIEGKNVVVEFFFANCEGICPVMNNNMMKVAEAFKNDKEFAILSHTVKPEEDTVEALFVYAQEHKANPEQWHFLTGPKKELYRMARKSYLMDNEEGAGDDQDFIHTQFFALIDKEKHIRGFYDGTNETEVQQLIFDIKRLKEEQEFNSEK